MPFCPSRALTAEKIIYILEDTQFFNDANDFGAHPRAQHREGLHPAPPGTPLRGGEQPPPRTPLPCRDSQKSGKQKQKGTSALSPPAAGPVAGRGPPSPAEGAGAAPVPSPAGAGGVSVPPSGAGGPARPGSLLPRPAAEPGRSPAPGTAAEPGRRGSGAAGGFPRREGVGHRVLKAASGGLPKGRAPGKFGSQRRKWDLPPTRDWQPFA